MFKRIVSDYRNNEGMFIVGLLFNLIERKFEEVREFIVLSLK